MTARLSVNINSQTAASLTKIASSADISYTETVRRAVEVLEFLTDVRDAGEVVQIYNPHTKKTREVLTL